MCWYFVKTLYTTVHFISFSFAQCGAVGKVVQDLQYTFVLDNQGVRLFSVNGRTPNEALLIRLLLGMFVGFTILLGSWVFPPHFKTQMTYTHHTKDVIRESFLP